MARAITIGQRAVDTARDETDAQARLVTDFIAAAWLERTPRR